MRTYDNGSGFTVSYSESDAAKFAAQWPASTVEGHGSFSFENNGDLIDVSGSAADNDGPDWTAFSQDCQKYAKRKSSASELHKPDQLRSSMNTLTIRELCDIKKHTPRTLADLDRLKPFNVRTLDHSQPHESYGGWINFLKTCEVRRWEYGVVYYGSSNCNYILFPNGTIIQNYAFWGDNLMRKIAENGWETVIAEIVKSREEFLAILNGMSQELKAV